MSQAVGLQGDGPGTPVSSQILQESDQDQPIKSDSAITSNFINSRTRFGRQYNSPYRHRHRRTALTGMQITSSFIQIQSSIHQFDNDPVNWSINNTDLVEHLVTIRFPDKNISDKFEESFIEYRDSKTSKVKKDT